MNQTLLKKPPPKQSNTIDEKHTEMLNYFNELETVTIPNLIKEKADLKAKIHTLKENEIDKYMDIKDKVLDIQKQIKEMKQLKV
jgi:cytoplasmic iron level regulating protein YaaA (DUF328/UPF0246 family)